MWRYSETSEGVFFRFWVVFKGRGARIVGHVRWAGKLFMMNFLESSSWVGARDGEVVDDAVVRVGIWAVGRDDHALAGRDEWVFG